MQNKKVLIIGGTGTLGTALIDELLKRNVHSIRIYSRNEHKQFQLRQKYGEPTGKMRYYIGDIRDKQRLSRAYEGVDIVINCAALKHVNLCNENPFECTQTNVIGVQNALECAVKHGIEAFVQISTDKAVNPANIYGCSKAMAEYLTMDAINWQGINRTKFCVIRSGNILASSGSCFEVWDKQYKNGEPLTVTDLNAVRYMESRERIAQAVVNIACNIQNGLYVLSMPKYKVSDLISKYEGAEVKITGLRQGEKLIEELYRENEKFTLVEV